ERLRSDNPDGVDFPALYFFQPKKLFFVQEGTVKFDYLRMVDDEMDADFEEIMATETAAPEKKSVPLEITARISKENYLKKIAEILKHLHRGDIYEVNFCQEFFAENATI